MGLIRKTLAVSTVGIVRPNSKKQREAKRTRKAEERQADALQALAKMEERRGR